MIGTFTDYFLPPGDGVIGGAVVSVLLVVLPAVRIWFHHMKPHHQRVKEIHDHLNPSHPFTIGDNQ